MKQPLNIFRVITFAASSVLITGCGGGSSSNDSSDHHADIHLESAGRLALYDQDSSSLKIMDLDSETIISDYALGGESPRLYASPNHRYAVIIQRSDDLVSFLDSGYYIEDHGDHLHEYAADPTFLNYSLNGSRPTHYTTHEDISAIFFDGQEGIVSSVTLLSDEGIGSDETVAELNLTNNMHGVAKLIDDLLFVTYRDPIITDTTLPAAVDRYSFLDNTLTFEHRYEEACPKLHGSAATEDFITFGCSDGVLSINLNEPLYPATKLSNPDTLLEENRIGTLYSHHEVNEFVGVAGNQFYVINPNIPDDAYLELPLPDEVSRVAQGFDAHGEVFYILGNDGNLYLFSASDWSSIIPIKVTDTVEEDGVSPAITVSQSDDLLFVLNAGGQEIFVVDSETGSTLRTITLDFTASRLVWLGLSENHDHEHHE